MNKQKFLLNINIITNKIKFIYIQYKKESSTGTLSVKAFFFLLSCIQKLTVLTSFLSADE